MPSRATVAVLFTQPETVLEDYARLFELAHGSQALASGKTTILKTNISWHFPMPSANTTPWQLEGTILALQKAGFTDLVSVGNKTEVTDAAKGEALNLFTPILEHYGIPRRYNFEPQDMRWVPYQPQAKMLALDHIYPQGLRLPDFFFGKNIVHLPTVKCHIYTTTTGAIKNAFGGLLTHKRHYTHTWIHETLVDLLAIQKEIHSGLFAVMDGTSAGNGPGPRTMTPVVKNIILASADQVAVDAVAARLMGFEPLDIPYIRLSHERGLGVGDTREIEIAGDDISGQNWQFQVGHNFHQFLAWLSWYGPTKGLQKLIMHTPIVVIPTLVSAAEHDLFYWPFHYNGVYKKWKKSTQWGTLFERYQRQRVYGV